MANVARRVLEASSLLITLASAVEAKLGCGGDDRANPDPSDPYVPNFADGIMCLGDLARVAAEECDLETCRKIDWILRELHRTLETGRDCLEKLGKVGQDLTEERRRARKWMGYGSSDYTSAEFRKGCQS